MTNQEKKEFCSGCYNNDYNYGLGGAKECWSLKTAKPVKKKEVHINDVPPWNRQRIVKVNSCYRKPQYVYVKPTQTY